MTLGVAFKEWAVICRALATGRQSVILRKGGIAEAGGVFTPEHSRFWLYPTYAHQQSAGVRPEARGLLERASADRPAEGVLRLREFAEVAEIWTVSDLNSVRRLEPFHVWSQDAVAKKFHYRQPGLFVLAVRVYSAPEPVEVTERPEFAGCKTWVELGEPIPTDGARPVIDEGVWVESLAELRRQSTSGVG